MRISRQLAGLCLATVLAGAALWGCANKKTSEVAKKEQEQQKQEQAHKEQQEAQMATSDTMARVRDVQTRAAALEGDAAELPGSDGAAENRQRMAKCFADLAGVLPQIAGPMPTSEFRQGMRVLESARQQLTSGSAELAAEPTVGQGLRAAERLLADLNSIVFENDASIAKALGELQQAIERLDTAHGATNRVLAADATRQAAAIIRQMATALADRAGIEPPATKPATSAAAAGGGK